MVKRMFKRRLGLLSSLVVSVAACSDPGPSPASQGLEEHDSLSNRREAIQGGRDDDGFYESVPAYGCTSVAISPRIVLTAGHCLDPRPFTGCGAFNPINFQFAGRDGILNTADVGEFSLLGSKAVANTNAFPDLSNCPAVGCSSTAASCDQLALANCPERPNIMN